MSECEVSFFRTVLGLSGDGYTSQDCSQRHQTVPLTLVTEVRFLCVAFTTGFTPPFLFCVSDTATPWLVREWLSELSGQQGQPHIST